MKLIITSRWNLWTLILRWEEPKQNHFFQVNLIHTSLLLHELHLLLPLICSSRFSNSFIHSSLDLVSYATPESEEPFSLLLIPQFFSWHPQRFHTCRRDGLRPRRLWADREPEQDINSRGSDQNQEITSALSFIHIPTKSLNKSLWKHGWWFLCCSFCCDGGRADSISPILIFLWETSATGTQKPCWCSVKNWFCVCWIWRTNHLSVLVMLI